MTDRPLPDVGRLRLLREVDRHGTLAGAARESAVTASAVSQQLTALEREVGVRLVDRGPRGATLTGAGRTLVDQASAVLDLLEQTRTTMDQLSGALAGRVRIGAIASAAAALLLPCQERLATSAPDIELEVAIAEPAATIDDVVAGRLDLALVDRYDHVPIAFPDYLTVRELLAESLVLVTSRDESFDRPPHLRDLRERAFVMPPERAACGAAVRYACRAEGFEPVVRWETDDLLLLMSAVARGRVVTVLPRLAVADHVADVRIHELAGAGLQRRILSVTRPVTEDRPIIRAVLDDLVPSRPSPR